MSATLIGCAMHPRILEVLHNLMAVQRGSIVMKTGGRLAGKGRVLLGGLDLPPAAHPNEAVRGDGTLLSFGAVWWTAHQYAWLPHRTAPRVRE